MATASALATTDAVCDSIKAVTDTLSVSAIADGVWDESLAAHTVAGSTGKALKQIKDGIISIDGSVDDTSATSTTFITNLTASTDGYYHDKVIVFVSGGLSGQARHIETYTGSTKSITVSQAFTAAPADGDEFLILATHEHSLNEISDAVWDELQSGHTVSGTFGYYLDSRVSQAGGGGDTGVTYIVGHVPDRAGPTDLMIFAGEAVSPVIETRDASCTPVDLTGKTMKVVIEKADGTDLETITSGSITVTTTTVSFPISTTTTNSGEKSVNWSLRDASTAEVYLYGTFYIQTVAI